MSFMVPTLSALEAHTLRRTAEQIVERADFGRQRAVMTGVPHRLVVNLDDSTYKLEWQGEAEARQAPVVVQAETDPDIEPSLSDVDIAPPLSLAPPPAAERSFEPVPGPLGAVEVLGRGVEFAWIETPGGDTDVGEASITFESDGTATYTLLVLNEPGGRELALEILPLAEAVRILDEGF